MKLFHFTAIDDDTQPIEYVVISENQDDAMESQIDGYEIKSSAELNGSGVHVMPLDRPLFPEA